MQKLDQKKLDELQAALTPEQFEVCMLKGTEVPFSGNLLHEKNSGMYKCVVCDQDLFSSDSKFDSGTGWPSFDDVVNSDNVELVEDNTLGMQRTEVVCKNCGAHLGHLFNDGPTKTKKRYCINSVALNFKKS